MSPAPRPDPDVLLAQLDALLGPPTDDLVDEEPPPPAPPAAEPAPVAVEAPSAAPAPRHPSPRVLIVEDNADYRTVLRYVLASHGYDVTTAADGAEGLKLAKAGPPDLAILDFEMPRMNGYELLQELRRSEETRRLPVVFLSAAVSRRQLRDVAVDVARFLEKPVTNETLLEVVNDLLGPAQPPVTPGAAAGPKDQAPAEDPQLTEIPPDDSTSGDELLIEEQKKEHDEDVSGLDVLANDSPLVNRINRILVRAVELGASDVHIEPQEKAILVRVRVDGTLRLLERLPIALQTQVAARVKIMSNLVITERRRPQDGQVRATINGKKIEFRVSTLPSLYGEKIVLRILGGAKLKESLKELQLSPRDLDVMDRALQSPHGLLLVTGPTGSGKSTTLYTMIRQLNHPDVNIMTAEDPVEYELAGITQVPVRAHIGVTFEAILRSFLRQDPDIMLVGEIRDLETAEIAVKAAITGHLVLSTLHTNSAPATISRLTHMGLAPFLVADSLKLVVAQRLVRKICRHCREAAPPGEEVLRAVGESGRERLAKALAGRGCGECGRSGYKGRMPVFEVMDVRTPEMRGLILENAGADSLAHLAAKEGMHSLREAALDAVAAGDTSVEEALSIIFSD